MKHLIQFTDLEGNAITEYFRNAQTHADGDVYFVNARDVTKETYEAVLAVVTRQHTEVTAIVRAIASLNEIQHMDAEGLAEILNAIYQTMR